MDIDYQAFAQAEEATKEEEKKKSKINILSYGYSPTNPSFPQLKTIWEMINGQYDVVNDYLVLPDDIYEQVDTYVSDVWFRFPQEWWTYPTSIPSGKPYALRPFKGVVPQSQRETIADKYEENIARQAKQEQMIFSYSVVADHINKNKVPIILGTKEDIEKIIVRGDFTEKEFLWLVTNEQYTEILGEYEWPSN